MSTTEVIKAMHNEHGRNLSSLHHDFLPTCSGAEIHEADKYFFKHCRLMEYNELRIHKKSGRVSVSKYQTKID